MSTVFVTSHLVVGDAPTHLSHYAVVPVDTALEAVKVIESDAVAVLPSGAWNTAEDVLRLFGADEKHIRFQVGTARQPVAGGYIPGHP